MVEIEKLRQEIDSLDNELMDILEKRFEVCGRVADYKKRNGLMIHDALRESQIIQSKIGKSDLNPSFVRELFEVILKESKRQMGERNGGVC